MTSSEGERRSAERRAKFAETDARIQRSHADSRYGEIFDAFAETLRQNIDQVPRLRDFIEAFPQHMEALVQDTASLTIDPEFSSSTGHGPADRINQEIQHYIENPLPRKTPQE